MIGKRLVNTGEAAVATFSSASFDSLMDVGVSTQSYWSKSAMTLSTDGNIYTTSRSGVGYWRLDKTNISSGTITNIASSTANPRYSFYGIAEKNGTLYINEYGNGSFNDITSWSKTGTRGSIFIENYTPNNTVMLNMAYSSVADEFLFIDYTDSPLQSNISFYNGSTGAYKRTIDITSTMSSYPAGIEWVNTVGDGVIFVMSFSEYRAYQFEYDGTYTGFYIDYSTYGTTRGRDLAFDPSTSKMYIACNDSQTSGIRDRHAVYTLS